ncbi:MAG: TrkH family potassium uptake protein [Solirubrobacterales bacterium]|nr:TrkH family potassium uptake protein [Solirubrobacterales bacterium]
MRPSLRALRDRHPAQLVALAFATVALIGAGLLALPLARSGPGSASLLEALFTSTSAVCVTGLTVVDTPTYWSGFGEAVILLLIQIGGFGIMTLASLLGLLVARRLGLRSRLTAQAETKSLGLGDVRRVIVGVVAFSLAFEVIAAVVLTIRLAVTYDESAGQAIYHGVFHSVSAFNNAGFSLYSDNLVRFVGDPVMSLTIAIAVIAGGLGFPVLFELRRELGTPSTWSLHTRIVVWMTVILLLGGSLAVIAFEWANPKTLGPMSVPEKLLAGFFQGVQPRTAGFNSLNYGDMNETTWLVTDVLMFIGGGPAGTAGGVKVTAIAVLAFMILAEVRGDPAVHVYNRRIGGGVQRQALSIVLLGMFVVATSTLALLAISDQSLDRVLFEAVSAFGTVGLTTGITADLPSAAQMVLIVLMFMGRVGTITLASALALRTRPILYRLPEERPIIG